MGVSEEAAEDALTASGSSIPALPMFPEVAVAIETAASGGVELQ